MDYLKEYEYWKNSDFFDESTRAELSSLTDEKEIEDRFYKDLEFGTAGLRGVLGAGTNRMNKYNVRRATAGFGKYLLKKYGNAAREKGIAIAYDCRHFSEEFALETALAMNALGIPAYLYDRISATPLLSFTVRELGCVGGVVVTSSHNPAEYNGYKAYDETGCQLSIEDADGVTAFVEATPIDSAAVMEKEEALEKGLLKYIGDEIIEKYLAAVQTQAHPVDDDVKRSLKIVYTPLHGAGRDLVLSVLDCQGYKNVSPVESQCVQDGDFPTVKSPNPEERSALTLAALQAEKEGADLVIATDPDSDRMAVAVKDDGKLVYLTGNQTGALLIDYILTRRKDSITPESCIITTIVTSEFGPAAAAAHGVECYKVLTGFKHICGLMNRFEKTGEADAMMGYEESYGYTVGTHARDKDGVVSSMLAAEMCAYYLAQGKTLADVLGELYAKLGYFLDAGDSYYFRGKEGAEKIRSVNAELRRVGTDLMPGISSIKDYSLGIDGLPKSDVLKYFFSDGSWIAIRPSGTEPKIKLYYCIHAENEAAAKASLDQKKKIMDEFVNG